MTKVLMLQEMYEKSLEQRNTEWGDNVTFFNHHKYAELVARECMIEIERLTIRNGDTEHNRALGAAWQAISDKFGVKST